MEYTRFPGAADEPPRADALRGLIEAFAPTGVSHIMRVYLRKMIEPLPKKE